MNISAREKILLHVGHIAFRIFYTMHHSLPSADARSKNNCNKYLKLYSSPLTLETGYSVDQLD